MYRSVRSFSRLSSALSGLRRDPTFTFARLFSATPAPSDKEPESKPNPVLTSLQSVQKNAPGKHCYIHLEEASSITGSGFISVKHVQSTPCIVYFT